MKPGIKLYIENTNYNGDNYKWFWGTLGCFLTNGEDKFFTTAAHCFGELAKFSDFLTSKNVYIKVDGKRVKVGWLHKTFGDIAVCRLKAGVGIDPFFAGVKSAKLGDIVYKHGCITGQVEGKITKKEKNLWIARPISNIEWSLSGDSGCPYYSKDKKLIGFGRYGNNEVYDPHNEWGGFITTRGLKDTPFQLITQGDRAMATKKSVEKALRKIKKQLNKALRKIKKQKEMGGGDF